MNVLTPANLLRCASKCRSTLLILMTWTIFSQSAFAHQAGVIDAHFTVSHSTVDLIYTIPTDQLEQKQGSQGLSDFVSNSFSIISEGKPCVAKTVSQKPLENIDSQQLIIDWQCVGKLGKISVTDHLTTDPNYQNFARISVAGLAKQVVFNQHAATHEFDIGELLALMNISLQDNAALSDTKDSQTSQANWKQADGSLNWQNFSQASVYLPVGLEHILLGPDHILFLIGLLLLITRVKALLILVTCFTLSHSLALALSVLNIVNLSSAVIEPLIALSIVYVALDNLTRLKQCKPGEPLEHGKYQWLLVTLFGFVHGFGFSYLLKEMGHSEGLLPTILFFNIGVEIGQLIIVVPLFLLLNKLPHLINSTQDTLQLQSETAGYDQSATVELRGLKLWGSVATALMGAFWLAQRTLF